MDNKSEIKIEKMDYDEALRYLGYKNIEPDDHTRELLLLCEKDFLDACKANYVYKVFELAGMTVGGCDFELEGEDIKRHLDGCTKVVFLCVTLGNEVDALIRKKQITALSEAVIIDSVASSVVEQACDEAENIIMKEFEGYEKTHRYGLGYGDFPLSGQKKFLATLDALKRVGVSVTDSDMLTPTKSVTCVIGLKEASDE